MGSLYFPSYGPVLRVSFFYPLSSIQRRELHRLLSPAINKEAARLPVNLKAVNVEYPSPINHAKRSSPVEYPIEYPSPASLPLSLSFSHPKDPGKAEYARPANESILRNIEKLHSIPCPMKDKRLRSKFE